MVQIPIQENGKEIYGNMLATLRVRARLGGYDDSAKIMLRLKILLRTRQDEYSINF